MTAWGTASDGRAVGLGTFDLRWRCGLHISRPIYICVCVIVYCAILFAHVFYVYLSNKRFLILILILILIVMVMAIVMVMVMVMILMITMMIMVSRRNLIRKFISEHYKISLCPNECCFILMRKPSLNRLTRMVLLVILSLFYADIYSVWFIVDLNGWRTWHTSRLIENLTNDCLIILSSIRYTTESHYSKTIIRWYTLVFLLGSKCSHTIWAVIVLISSKHLILV